MHLTKILIFLAKVFVIILELQGALSAPCLFAQNSLVNRAEELRLWDHPYWQKLMHYRKGLAGTIKSEVSDINFFHSSDGWNDPKRELIVNIEHLFSSEIYQQREGERMLARCKFPARFKWLSQQLQGKNAKDQLKSCQAYQKYRSANYPEDIWFVFASYNPPSFLLGDTFLRFSRQPSFSSSDEPTDIGVSYAAAEPNLLSYSIYGVVGKYSFRPYSYMTQMYGLESRDTWSYKLVLNEEEKDRLVDHLWEISATSKSYNFCTENSSYQILALLEITREDLDLRRNLNYWTVPSETVRVVLSQPGLVSKVRYQHALSKERNYSEAAISTSEDKRPGQGHRSGRLAVGGKIVSGQGFALQIAQRFALHDILDPTTGYPDKKTMEFLNIEGTLLNNIVLDKVSFAHVKTLYDSSLFSPPISWEADFGWRRRNVFNPKSTAGAFVEGGGGVSRWFSRDEIGIVGMLKAAVDINTRKATFDLKPNVDLYYFAFEKLRANAHLEFHDTLQDDLGVLLSISGRYSLQDNQGIESFLASDWLGAKAFATIGLRYFIYY